MVGAATYFVMSAEEGNGLPPLALLRRGLLVGAVALVLAGVVGIVPMAATTDAVEFVGTTAPWWVPVLALGVVTAALAYVTGIAAGRRLGSRLASFVALSEVVASLVFAWLLLGELPRPVQRLGGLVILIGVVMVKLDETGLSAGSDTSARKNAHLGGGVGQRSSWRRMKTSLVSIRRAAAVGMASSAPTTPSSAAPTSAAITVSAPGMSTAFDITRG